MPPTAYEDKPAMPDLTLPRALLCLPLDWQNIARDFLRHIFGRRQSEESLSSYRMMLVQFFTAKSWRHPATYTRADIESFMWRPCRRSGSPPAPGTRNCRLKVIRSFYNFAASYQPIKNPTTGIPRAQSELDYRALSIEEVERFFAAIPDTPIGIRDRCIFQMYFWTGKRREEICRLRYGDIEEAPYLQSGWRFRYIGKGKAGRPSYAELPKPAKAALDRYLHKSGRIRTIQPEDPLFIPIGPPNGGGRRRSSGLPMDSDTIAMALKKYARKANLKPMSIHSWRHTAARTRLEKGLNIVLLKEFLGHVSLDYTYIYAKSLIGIDDPGAKLLESDFAFLTEG